jgi:hypothetical protein
MASFHMSIKSAKPGTAANHAAYIAREGKHGQDGRDSDLVASFHGNLPDWAENKPAAFWKAADKHERANAAVYREVEFALPRELCKEEHVELVSDFIRTRIGDKPFQAAIHMPNAALGAVTQPHAHVMFSDRLPDGIERSKESHFRRYNPADPELGGCKKDSGGKDRNRLKSDVVAMREGCASIQNTYLERSGSANRVDHRSYRDRGIEKEPERHLGQVRIKLMGQEEKALFQQGRESRQLV